ncbi:hypothetical protein P152DRAFT_457291 [Eremomyces bilateralis CBS 781.70]|uniref:NAP family protein n=1 Tax=Eremomyces bilateralis CBS 781.70 TaxID=1392243 RepID=A0A6G1G7K3_9PEZI|nr:uncharacterized protein P152DRAFT_457291 [Eremomyces bilateralis CBS 781.70]KAF1813916.1 hypothetical protein P152DRAFT_457291 [Eremomyces bilateralis CBS 781.70]
MDIDQPQPTVFYEELSELEHEFDVADLEIIRKQWELNAPLYAKREALISKIPNFWALVFEQSPPEFDQFIQPSDSELFADCLRSLAVDRFELADSPRSISVKFTFAPNQWFDDEVLEKKFWFRRARDGWTGLVSEPVKIHWKKGKDLTKGLTDAAAQVFERERNLLGSSNGAGDAPREPSADYVTLAKKLESNEDGIGSFFTFFGFVSEKQYVSAEESAAANRAEDDRRKARKEEGKGEEEPEEDLEDTRQDVEICPHGGDIAALLAEDIWANAVKYFTSAQEMDDEELSDMEFEEGDWDVSDEEIDIRALVKGKRKEKNGTPESGPPSKTQKR